MLRRVENDGLLLHTVRDGETATVQPLNFVPRRLAVAADNSIYALNADSGELTHAAASATSYYFESTSRSERFDELVAIDDGAIAVTCSGPATFYRWHP